jgi:hypothetical protein
MTSSLEQYPQRDGLYRIMADGIAVHNRYQDRVVMLDAVSCELWLRADGKTILRDIAQDIAGQSGQRIETLFLTIPMLLTILSSEGLMYQVDQPRDLPYHLALPQEEQDIDQMRESMAASGWLDE